MRAAPLDVARRTAPWLWGALVAAWVCDVFFRLAPGEMPYNHETYGYVHRIVEFQDLLRAGYLFPHWAVDFRGGLGSPYFGYYQPGFFYLASLFAFVLPMPAALATTLWSLTLAGYGGVLALVRARFGVVAGMFAGTAFLLAPYVHTELTWRGDFSEAMGMMLLPATMHWLTAWLDGGGRGYWRALAAGAAGSIVSHPVAGLFGYGALVVVTACWVAMGCDRRRAAAALGALGVGVGLAAFYLVPIALDWHLVQGDLLTKHLSEQPLQFVELRELFAPRARSSRWPVPVALGLPAMLLAALAVATAAWRWQRRTPAQRRFVVAMLVLASGTVWLLHPSSRVLWEAVPLLRMAQFPWRALFVLTPVLAIVGGCLVEGRRTLAAIGLVLYAASTYAYGPAPVRHWWPHPADARAIASGFVAPDAANEWLPKGAMLMKGPTLRTAPTCAGICRVEDFERTTARLQARITTAGRAEVVLPHYYFPVGWTATLDGVEVPLERTAEGLMRVVVEKSGRLDVRFGTTPARRLGVTVSAAVLGLLVLGAVMRRRRASRTAAGLLALVVFCTGTIGCRSVTYLARGGLAEARILWRRQPIADLLARSDLDRDLRERLALVLQVRTFAAEGLGLDVGESFTTFADVDGDAVVWVVSAAHRDRLEPYTWWYPVVGRVPYQGYFERAEAEDAARRLAAQGLDVDVRAASAFSTLGWFSDPLLSTTARTAPVALAETVIHELFHATLYVPSAVEFNESAATFVGHRGAMAFFCDGPGRDTARCGESQARWRRVRAHARLLERYVRRVRALYAANLPEPARERVRARLAEHAARAVRRRGLGAPDELSPPNNARLLAMLAYETDLAAFERLAPAAATLPTAIERIVGAARGARDPFAAVCALD